MRRIQEEGLEWKDIFLGLWRTRLAPLFYFKGKEFDLLGGLPEETAYVLYESFRANQIRNFLYQRELSRIVGIFCERGIDVAVLKGALFILRNIHGHSGARVMNDIDLLVAPQNRAETRRILAGSGYRLFEAEDRHDSFLDAGGRVTAEIHYSLFGAYLERDEASALNRRCWERKVRLAGCPDRAFALSPADTLFFHIYHAFAHHIAWIYDSLPTYIDFIALSRNLEDGCLEDVLQEASRCGLEPFFTSFLHILEQKTGWKAIPGMQLSGRMKSSLDRFIAAETFRPQLHGVHARRLVLCGFGRDISVRIGLLRHMAAMDCADLLRKLQKGSRSLC